jgi:hypothetical protein
MPIVPETCFRQAVLAGPLGQAAYTGKIEHAARIGPFSRAEAIAQIEPLPRTRRAAPSWRTTHALRPGLTVPARRAEQIEPIPIPARASAIGPFV